MDENLDFSVAMSRITHKLKLYLLLLGCTTLLLSSFHQGEPLPRDATYYKSKGFQVFSDYKLAVKCECTLQDGSRQIKNNYDLAYLCASGSKAAHSRFITQILVKKNPVGLASASATTKRELEEKLFSRLGGKRVTFNGQRAIVTDNSTDGTNGRAISFMRNGATFSFIIYADNNLDEKFSKFTNNIFFTE